MIADNVAQVQETIAAACMRAGRDPETVTLIAVTKTRPVAMIHEALQAGVQHFGENRVEEAEAKIRTVNAAVDAPPTWHMIGHIQSRKARFVVPSDAPLFDMVHSLDSLKIAGKLSRLAEARERVLDVLVQINVSGEASKSGLDAAGWAGDKMVRARLAADIQQVLALPGLAVCGLMTIAPIAETPQDVRPVFADLRQLREALQDDTGHALPHLSMGMTDDYPVAIEEGATMVRIGRAIFGERPKL